MKFRHLLVVLSCATFLQPGVSWAVDITTPTTIYTGSEYGSADITINNSRLRFGTVETEATLSSRIAFRIGAAGTLSVTPTSILNVNSMAITHDYDLTLGTLVDTGTLVINGATYFSGSAPFPPRSRLTIAGGTVIVNSGGGHLVDTMDSVKIDTGALLIMNTQGSPFGLQGTGVMDMTGHSLSLNLPSFDGEIRNVSRLTISSAGSTDSATLGGVLINVNQLVIGNGSKFTLSQPTIVPSIGNVGSISVGSGSVFDLGLNNVSLNSVSGSGKIQGGADITINGGNFDGTLLANGDLYFTGTTSWAGQLDSARKVILASGARLTIDSSTVFTGGVPVEIDGIFIATTDASIGGLSGDGAIFADEDLTVGVGGASSQFDGSFDGYFGGLLIKAGTGTLTLGQTSSIRYGSMRIDDGSLLIQTSDAVTAIENNASVVFDLGARDDTHDGALSGSGTFTKLGSGTLTLSGNNAFSGTFEIFGGGLLTDALGLQGNVVNDALVTFDETSSGTYASTMSGSGALVKTGAGRLNWTGTGTFAGGTEVEEGLLSVNGSLAGLVTVDDGAALGGSGTVGAFDALSGATIAPGNSIGTLTVAGNADFAAGSLYDVEVDGLGNADMIDVGGVLTVSSDASVNVSPENGIDTGIDYASPLTYTIATAAGGVSGTFGSVADSFAFLDSSLSYDANNIYLTLTRLSFATDPGNDNEEAVGEAIDSLPNGSVTDALLGVTDDERADALRDLSGEIHASIGQGLNDAASSQRNRVLSELATPGRGRYWSIAHGMRSHFEADGVSSEGSMSGGGVLFGGDLFQSEGLELGIMAGYEHLGMTLADRQSEADVESVSLGAYGLLENGPMALSFGGLSSWHAIDTERDVAFSSLDDHLTADYRGSTVQLFAEARYAVETGSVTLEPYLGGALVYGRRSDFAETGGAAALSGAAEDQFAAYGTAGLRLRHELMLAERKVRLEGELGLQHILDGDRSAAVLAFDGSDNFRVEGKAGAQNAGLLTFGLSTAIAAGADVSVSYDARFGDGDSLHAVKAGLRVSF
jgi:outer membrane autotransporter protein